MGEPLIEKSLHTGRAHQPRKLIVCVDGTSNQFSEKNTHVVELYSRIIKDPTQLTYYNSGVGTYAPPFWWSLKYQWQKVTNAIDLMIAWNFDRVILGAYRWLSDTYQPGDQIFLFGFSRGAYQVRTLAGMIEKVGLIHPGNQEQIPFAWAIYSKNNSELTQSKFKEAFCRESVDLHFIGVWDTVASVGVVPRKPFPLSDQCGHITHFRHALALDECRVKFLPEHVSTENTAYKKNRSLKEVWFTGTHSDIGGGNKANPNLDRGGEPLKWIMEEVSVLGLPLIPEPRSHALSLMEGMIRGKIGYYLPTANEKVGKTDPKKSSEDTCKLSRPSISLDHGSTKLATAIARLAVRISTEPTYQLAHGEPLNGGIAKLGALLVKVILALVHNDDHVVMEGIATWRQSEVDLAYWILTAVSYLNPNDAAKETFYQLKIGSHLSPLIRSKNTHPDLAMTALYLVTTLSHEPRFGAQIANSDVVPAIIEILKGEFDLDNPVKKLDLVRVSLQAAASLSEYADCRTTLGEKGIISHLFELLDKASFTIDSLKVLKNISTEFPENFEERNIEIVAKYMDEHADASIILANIVDSPGFNTKCLEVYGQYEIATKARGLIRNSDDGRVQVIVRLLRSLVKAVTRPNPFGEDKIFSFKLMDLSQEIVDSLPMFNSSEHSLNQLLTVILAIAIKEPLPGDVPKFIGDLASQGNKWAILVALALLSHREDCQENINEYFKKFRKVIKRLDILNEQILPDMMTVLTILVEKDRLQPSFRIDVTGIPEYIVIGAYLGTLYPSNKEMDSSREYVTLAALDLIERLYANAEVRKERSPSEVLGVIHLKLDSEHVSLNIKTRVETMLDGLSQYDNIKEKILHAREMAAVHSG